MSGADRGLRARIRYRVDNLLSRSTWAVLLWLGALTAAAVLVSSLLLVVFGVRFTGSADSSWIEDVWQSLLRTLDPGTMAGDAGWGPRALALVVSVFGILVAGTLIGLIANGVEQRVEELQRGRSTVMESGHTVVLGSSSRLPTIVGQLALGSKGREQRAIVVLADDEPGAVREAIVAGSPDLRAGRLVVRSGRIDRVSDLAMVRVDEARAVIVVAEEDARSDTGVVTAVLAVGAAMGGFGRVPVVAELVEPTMALRLVEACGPSVHPLLATQAIARTTSYSLREPVLQRVVDELLDYRGSDIYVHDLDGLAGLSFAEVVRSFDTARPIGVLHGDATVTLNPAASFVPAGTDRLVVIAPDASLPRRRPEPWAAGAAGGPVVGEGSADAPRRERLLVVGWNALGATLLTAVGESCAPGSTAEVVYDPDLVPPDDVVGPEHGHLTVTATARPRLTWHPDDVSNLDAVTSVVLLGYRSDRSPGEADSRTLLNLMLLRPALDRLGDRSARVVVELRDVNNVELARMSGADDYIVSDAVASRLMAQLAEQPERRAVLLSLYFGSGASLRMVPTAALGLAGTKSFETVVSVAQAAGVLAIGWRVGPSVDGLRLNPPATAEADLGPDAEIIVIG